MTQFLIQWTVIQLSWADRIGWVLVHSLWQFALVMLFALVLQRALRRCAATTRYGTLLAVMAMLVAVPVATWFSPWCVDAPVAAAKVGPVENPAKAFALDASGSAVLPMDFQLPNKSVPSTGGASGTPLRAQPAPFSLAAWLSQVQRRIQPWLPQIVLVWLVGVLVAALRPLLSWYTVRRLRTIGVSPVADAVQSVLERTAKRLGLARAVEVLQSTLAQTPMVVGCFRPVVLLPLCVVTGLSVVQLEAILAHELAHIRRHDYLVNLLQTLVETLIFYHPAVWWLSRQIRNERENCCDDAAMDIVGSRADYGRALLAIEELRAASTGLALAAQGGSLLARIRRIAGCESAPRVAGGGFLCVVLVSLMVLTAVTWAATPTIEKPEQTLPATAKQMEGAVASRLSELAKPVLTHGSERPAPPELMTKLLEANRHWLRPEPSYLSYTFSMEHPGQYDQTKTKVEYTAPCQVTVQTDNHPPYMGLMHDGRNLFLNLLASPNPEGRQALLQGVYLFGPLQELAVSQSGRILSVVGEEMIDGVETLVLHLRVQGGPDQAAILQWDAKLRRQATKNQHFDENFYNKLKTESSGPKPCLPMSVGCGVFGTQYGGSSSHDTDVDQLWVEKATGRILREEGFREAEPRFVVTYGDYEKTSDNGQVPRQIVVRLLASPTETDGRVLSPYPWVFDMGFQLLNGNTWLLKELKESQDKRQNVAVAAVTDASTSAADSKAAPSQPSNTSEDETVSPQPAEQTTPITTEEEIAKQRPWIVVGRVTDEQGQPMEGVTLRAHCGMGTLFQTGITETDKNGRYTLRFAPGMHISSKKAGEVPVNLQAATISVEKPGFVEKNLHRRGDLTMAARLPSPDYTKWGKSGAPILPNKPVSLDFVLVPAATIDVEVLDAEEEPMVEKSMWLSGKELPPSSSILSGGKRNAEGRLQFDNVPTNFAWWFGVQVASGREVRSPSMMFAHPEKYGVQLRLRRDGSACLEVLSVKNAKGEEVREQVCADDPTSSSVSQTEPPIGTQGTSRPSQPQPTASVEPVQATTDAASQAKDKPSDSDWPHNSPETMAMLRAYEKTLVPYERMKGTWTCKTFELQEGLEPRPLKSAAPEVFTVFRDTNRAKVLALRQIDDGNPQKWHCESVIQVGDTWLAVFPASPAAEHADIPVLIGQLNVSAKDLPKTLGKALAAETYGVTHEQWIPALLRASTLSAETDMLGGYGVYVLRGVSGNVEIKLWLDPKLGYAAKKITYVEHRKEPECWFTRDYEVKRFRKASGVFVPMEATITHRFSATPVMSSIIDEKAVERKAVNNIAPASKESYLWEVKLADIDLDPKFTDADFKISQPVPDGTPVSVQDAPRIPDVAYEWRQGKVVKVGESAIEDKLPDSNADADGIRKKELQEEPSEQPVAATTQEAAQSPSVKAASLPTAISGRVLDHENKPVEGARVFLRGRGSLRVENSDVDWHSSDDSSIEGPLSVGNDEPNLKLWVGNSRLEIVRTDADGRFRIARSGKDYTHVIVLAPGLHMWAETVPAEDSKEEVIIRLSQPATLKVVMDIPGAVQANEEHAVNSDQGFRVEPAGREAWIRLHLMTWDMDGWKEIGDFLQTRAVANPGEVVFANLTPGLYDFSRTKMFTLGDRGQGAFCDRQLNVKIAAGETKVIRLVRNRGQRVRGEIRGLPEDVSGAVIAVRPSEVADDVPTWSDEWTLPTFDYLTCQSNGLFLTSMLEPGQYKIIAHAYRPQPKDGIFSTAISTPDFIGTALVTVLDDDSADAAKPAPSVTVEMKPRQLAPP